MHDLTELIDDLPTEALELYVAEWEGPGVGDFSGYPRPIAQTANPTTKCRCPRASLGYRMIHVRLGTKGQSFRFSDHPADIIEEMAYDRTLDTEALYRACKAAILARDAAVERVREEVRVG